MESKEMKKTIPVELDDDALDNVSGGTATAASMEYLNAQLQYAQMQLEDYQNAGGQVTTQETSNQDGVVTLPDFIGQSYTCGTCGKFFWTEPKVVNGVKYCPACGAKLYQ